MKNFLFVLFSFLIFSSAFATHNKAGEITYRHDPAWGLLTYEITITTYTDSSKSADRNKLEILWGDGTSDTLVRGNGPDVNPNDGIPDGVYIGHSTKKNTYVGMHTYPGSSSYVISMEDLNRVDYVINMPNSVSVAFFIKTILVIDSSIQPPDNSPVLTIEPVDNGCVNNIFIHNAGAYDPDHDSLSYEMDSSRGNGGLVPSGYTIPSGISLNPVTGDFVWNVPTQVGIFNFAFRIVEWRNGYKIGYVTRDLMVVISNCQNHPPIIQPPPDLCVLAGDSVSFKITATDIDNDLITLTSYGATYHLATDSSLFLQDSSSSGYSRGSFFWQTNCSHISKQPYNIYFKAEDNSYFQLVDIQTVSVKVIAPPPRNPTAVASGTSIILNWLPGVCGGSTGYVIFRRNGHFNGTIPCPCETGVPSYAGFTQIATVLGAGTTTFTDDNNGAGLIHGNDYCYLIVAVYPDGAQSCASPQVCAELKKDVPVITNVDILQTDLVNGKIYVAWSKPTEIDTIANPGPFHVDLLRSADGGVTYSFVISKSSINDTVYTDTYNTVSNSIYYKLELYNDVPAPNHKIGTSHSASSVFLIITPTDNRLDLSWNENVPWTNSGYDIFRFNNSTSQFDSIGSTGSRLYSDTGLENGITYCYRVRSKGAYSGTGFINPILNKSQELCGIPIDNVPPCPPVLTVKDDCTNYQNFLTWNNPNNSCSDDVVGYKIYYSATRDGVPALIATINSANDTTFLHDKLFLSSAGCYLVTSVDSAPASNESINGQKVCVESCPEYTLPNVFTPDGNGLNDFLRPFPYRFIASIDLQLFNRWGLLVFKTADPDINWDGNNMQSKKPCSDGVYFYVCRVDARQLDGIKSFELKGFIHIINTGISNPSN